MLGLPKEKRLILFGALGGATDERKGYRFLAEAVKKLAQAGWGERVELVTFGSGSPGKSSEFGIPTNHLGRLYDEISLAMCYAAADLFVSPSIEDNLPNTVLESLACGVPVVAFDIGGMPDMIEHKIDGYLARPQSAEDLANGIAMVVADPNRYKALAEQARKKAVQEYALGVQAKRYQTLFDDILADHVRGLADNSVGSVT